MAAILYVHAYVKRDYQMEIQGLGCPAKKSKATIWDVYYVIAVCECLMSFERRVKSKVLFD